MPDIPSSASQTWQPQGAGYTCAVCHIFVPSGTTHFCQGTPYQRAAEVTWDQPSHQRIAAALERIAAALEAQNTDSKS